MITYYGRKHLKRIIRQSQADAFKTRFLTLWKALAGPELESEVPFKGITYDRRWRWDYVVKGSKIAIELDGGTYINGAHSRGKQIKNDHEKRNQATALGWKVFVLTTDMIKTEFVEYIVHISLGGAYGT